MAREAKVGLLLGLIFIVAIAIVLRGVHETSHTQLEQSLGISPESVKPLEMETLSVAVESLASDKEKMTPTPRETRRANQTVVIQPVRPASQQNPLISQPSPPQPIRYEQELPRRPYPQSPSVPNPPQANQPLVSPSRKLPDSITAALDKITFQPANRTINNAAAFITSRRPKAGLYIVRKGDDLSRIALKVYGREEGKRWVNVKKIYQANRQILPSADRVHAGQRLTIPPLAHRIAPQPSSQVLPQKKQPVPHKRPQKTRRVYVVKEGDSLWKIAEKQLGNGGRYNEIMGLNTTSLRDEDNLFVGMRLKLPLQ